MDKHTSKKTDPKTHCLAKYVTIRTKIYSIEKQSKENTKIHLAYAYQQVHIITNITRTAARSAASTCPPSTTDEWERLFL